MKKLLISSALILSLAGTISYMVNKPIPTTADDVPPLVQEVQRHDEQLANHEARISNTENDVRDLQGNTSTAPSSNKQSVPGVITQAPLEPLSQPSQPVTPSPIVVVSSHLVVGGTYDGYCQLIYSDNSIAYKKATISTVDHGNGSYSTKDNCQDFIGQPK